MMNLQQLTATFRCRPLSILSYILISILLAASTFPYASANLDPRGPQPPPNAAALADGGLFSNNVIAKSNDNALHIVFVVTTIPGFCGPFPANFKQVLLQAKASNKKSIIANNTDITILSNFKQCRWSLHDLKNGDELELRTINTIDSHTMKSNRTLEFEKLLKKLIPKGGVDDMDTVTTSLYKYFMLEDYMTRYKVSHVLHFESDNMLYGDMFPLLSTLRSSQRRYGNVLAVNPSIHKRFLSSSTMWIGGVEALHDFNEFLLEISRNTTNQLSQYTSWLHEFACCKDKGMFPNAEGKGLKLWAFSDMTLLAYYRHLHHGRIKLFPCLPFDKAHYKTEVPHGMNNNSTSSSSSSSNSNSNSNSPGSHHVKHLHVNVSLYSQGGSEVSDNTEYGLFDSGKGGWGSHFHNGGVVASTSSNKQNGVATKEEESQSVAHRHIIEQAVSRFNCTVEMKCTTARPDVSKISEPKKDGKSHHLRRYLSDNNNSSTTSSTGGGHAIESECYTRPFVTCGKGVTWTALWSLHIPKSESSFGKFKSQPCACSGAL